MGSARQCDRAGTEADQWGQVNGHVSVVKLTRGATGLRLIQSIFVRWLIYSGARMSIAQGIISTSLVGVRPALSRRWG